MSGRQMETLRRGAALAVDDSADEARRTERLAGYGIRGIVTRMMPVVTLFGRADGRVHYLPVSLPRVRFLDRPALIGGSRI